MYSNHPEVQAFLERGGTLLVPTRQRSAAIALAYTATLLESGASTWDSPDVLHWSAWQGRRLDATRSPRAGALRRLATVEDWYLWREALQDPGAAHGLVQPDGLLEDLQRADELIDAWGLPAGAAPGVEGALLGRLRQRVEQRRRQLRGADRLGWRDSPRETRSDIWCLGFDEIGRADRHALESLGVRIGAVRGAEATHCVPRIVAAAHPDAESRLIADWCREHLQRDPRARLLVLVPRPSQYDTPLRSAFGERLGGDSILNGTTDEPLFAVEGGTSLPQFPLVATARDWLRLVCGRVEFGDYSALLRSCYLRAGGIEARSRLEIWLRHQQITALEASDAERLLPQAAAALGVDAAEVLSILQRLLPGRSGHELPAVWAQRWVDWLQAAGWPGECVLGSREQQVRQRFEQLLGEIAQLGDVAGPCSAGQALAWLEGWLQRASFEPASGDVPVTVSADLRDPLLRYDGIWVCGLTAQDWPPAAVANPFVSLSGLLAAGSDAGTAGGALRRADEAMSAWLHSTDNLVCSWPRQVGDAVLLPSPLLSVTAEEAEGRAVVLPPRQSPWHSDVAARERYGRMPAQPWPQGRMSRGGVSVLEQQSRCPFQGFALGRLRSDKLELPQAGISAQTHGIVLHDALQRIWQTLGDSATLQARQAALDALVRDAVALALRRARRQALSRLPDALWKIEATRCERLILTLLELELRREPFAVVAMEDKLVLQSQGVGLGFKLDRLDRLDDGRHVLIDYKSGKLRSFDPLAERPENPQLLAYASALDKALCAVAAAHLNVEGSGWQGAADTASRLPRVKPAAFGDGGWPALLQRWRTQIDGLLAEFAAGESRLDPLPRACERCHLSGLCRIAENELALNESGDDAAADGGGTA